MNELWKYFTINLSENVQDIFENFKKIIGK